MLGSKVIGEAEAARQQQIRDLTAGNVLGSRVTGVDMQAALDEMDRGGTITAPPPIVPSYSVTKLAALLTQQPDLYDALLAAELERVEGPRKSAAKLFATHARTLGRDAEEIALLEQLASGKPAESAGEPTGDGDED